MRACLLSMCLSVAVLVPITGSAQAFSVRTPAPEVTAAAADWQINSDPIVVSGLVYYPTRGFRMFDGQVMAQIAVFDGVPIYADTTLEPYSVVYVPVGRDRMREYERRRDRELAGTTGSRAPSFPVAVATDRAPREPAPGTAGMSVVGTTGIVATGERSASGATGTTGAVGTTGANTPPNPTMAIGTTYSPDRGRNRRSLIESIPPPGPINGVWLEFNGARWYLDGPAATFSPDRFEPVGEYRGFPVYRDKSSTRNEIWISVVKDGPVAPYTKR
jgi:hypothetical protein